MIAWLELLRETARRPREVMRELLARDLGIDAVLALLAFGTVVSAMLTKIGFLIAPAEVPPYLIFMTKPVELAALQFGMSLLYAAVLNGMLQIGGSQTRYRDVLLALAWLQCVLCALLIPQVVLVGIAPVLANLAGLVSFLAFPILLTIFSAEAAGFRSYPLAFLLSFAALMITAVTAAWFMLLTGVIPPMEEAYV